MGHTVTGKLNKAARQHPNASGVTFFVSIGEQNYDFQQKQKVWTNYDAALFAKDGQIQFYADNLVEGAIVSVSAKGLIVEQNEQYGPKLKMVDAQLEFSYNPAGQAPQQMQQAPMQQAPQQMAPQMQQAPQQQAPQQMQQPMQQAPQQQMAPQQGQDFSQDVPF